MEKGFQNNNIRIISKRVGVIQRIQGLAASSAERSKDSAAFAEATSGQEGSSEIL